MATVSLLKLSVQIQQQCICYELSIKIEPGEIWGILGANGIGKSTLLRTMAGFHPPRAGKILLNQHGLTELPNPQKGRLLGVMWQNPHYAFPQSVYEFCYTSRYPHLHSANTRQHHDHVVRQALATMDLSSFAHTSIHHLSGGESQRLRMAALLAQDPEVFLLDEPTNHLDCHYQIQLLNTLRDLSTKKAKVIIMSLHDINIASRFCHKLILLYPQAKVLIGRPNELLTAANISALYNHPMQQVPAWQPTI